MGRPATFSRERILAAARALAAHRGPAAVTMAGLAERLGAPVGSIYHRYASRDVLLADMWLGTVESFQHDFLAALEGPEPVTAGLEAVRFASRWVRQHPDHARLLLLHRRDDFLRGHWPEEYRQRAERLHEQAEQALRAYCRRLYGDAGARNLRRVRLAVSDLPQAACRRSIESGTPLPRDLEQLVEETCRHILQGD